jgi:arylformamidase
VVDSEQYLTDWLRRSEALCVRMPGHLNLVYGDAPRARLDFFTATRSGAPTPLFFHGVYWQRNAKEGFSFIAEGPLAHGFNVGVVGYTLAPEARLDGIVREARMSLHWLHQRLSTLGGDPARLYVGGCSAGGHLAAMLMDEPLVAGGLAISGLFDLEPIRLCYLNEKLGLDAEQARRNSPLLNVPARAAKLIIAYGAAELLELKRQSREFGAAWTAHGLPGEMIEVAGCHHYAVLEQLAQPDGLLAEALTATAGVDPA